MTAGYSNEETKLPVMEMLQRISFMREVNQIMLAESKNTNPIGRRPDDLLVLFPTSGFEPVVRVYYLRTKGVVQHSL